MDIMVKQSHNLIDRPRSVAGGEIISNGMRILMTSAGDRLRRMRRCASCYISFSRPYLWVWQCIDGVSLPFPLSTSTLNTSNRGTALAGLQTGSVGSSLHAVLQRQTSAKYEPIQMYNARNFVLDILADPERHIDHARR